MTKKVLVCGSSGFIGRNIAETLAKNEEFEVFGSYLNSNPPDNPRITPVQADLRNKEEVEKIMAGKDIVVQAAATTSGAKDIVTKPYIHVTDNAVMNSLIFRSAFENKVSNLLFFSCTVMYQPSDKPVKETDFDPSKEIFPSYFGVGWTKVYIEKMAQFFSRISDTKFTVIRHSNVYGPYDKFDLERSHVFGATLTKVLTNESGKIKVWGTGEEERDLIYVSDLVDFTSLALERQKDRFGLYNVGAGYSIPVRDLVARVIKHSGKNIGIEYDITKPTIKTKLAIDCTKAKQEIGWEPRVSLDEGITRAMSWYRENILK